MAENKKRRHHFVSQSYLKAWKDGNKVWCLRETVFPVATGGIALLRDFYRLERLTSGEVKFLLYTIENAFPKELVSVHKRTLMMHLRPFMWEDYLRKENLYFGDIAAEVDRVINDTDENFHDKIEGGVAQICLQSVVAGNISFWADMPKKFAFLHFISLQYFRTKRMADAVTAQSPIFSELKKAKELDLDMARMWRVNRLMLAHNVAHSLVYDPEYELVLLENLSGVPFITGDNVAVNTYSVDESTEAPTEYEFYYPVSPRYAALVTKRQVLSSRETVNAVTAHEYNVMMMKVAQEMIFSSNKEQLDQYAEYFLSKKGRI